MGKLLAKTNGYSRWGALVTLLRPLPLRPLQRKIFTTFAAGAQANENPRGAPWTLEEVETLAALIPTQTKKGPCGAMGVVGKQRNPRRTVVSPVHLCHLGRKPIVFRPVLVNGEPLLIGGSEDVYLALSLSDQLALANYLPTSKEQPEGDNKAPWGPHKHSEYGQRGTTLTPPQRRTPTGTSGSATKATERSERGSNSAERADDEAQDLAFPPDRAPTPRGNQEAEGTNA
jgi:hypothetical protein